MGGGAGAERPENMPSEIGSSPADGLTARDGPQSPNIWLTWMGPPSRSQRGMVVC